MAPQDDTEQREGMSTRKKLAAGAALGVAVPTVVGVAKKLMSSTGDTAEDAGRATAGGAKRAAEKASSTASSAASRTGGTAKRAASGAKRTASGAGRTASKSASTSARSTSSRTKQTTSRARRSASSATEKTKEQLYDEAKRLGVEGRSTMTKTQLKRAVARKRS